MAFADTKYAGKRKQTRKELFLIKMEQVMPWEGLISLIESHYPEGEDGRLGSVRKVLPQASQRASQRDHCGKTPGELVVTGDNSPVFF